LRVADGGDFLEGVLACEHHELRASSRAKFTPAALVMVICVEQWIGKSARARGSSAEADVLHDGGVGPEAMMLRA